MSKVSLPILTAVTWIFTGLAILLTASRFWIRCKIIKRIAWDDAAHLLGLLFLLAQVSIVTAAAYMLYRYSEHAAEDASLYEAGHPLFVRLNIASILVTWCCLYAIKMSFLLLYRHIFRVSKNFIRAWWTVLGVVVTTFWILIAGTITQCGSPVALERVESCLSPSMMQRQVVFVIYSCVLNVFSDLAIMALPLAMLKGLQMRTPAKLGLVGVFACAFITIAFDILRAIETDTQGGIEGSTAFWTNLESAVAVIVSCLPSLTALFNRKSSRKDGRNVSPYRQRSLTLSESAKLCISAGNSLKSGSTGHTSTAGALKKSNIPSSDLILASTTGKPVNEEHYVV